MPLEEAFSKVKYFLNEAIYYDSTDDPDLLLTLTFTTITEEDCSGYIHHIGYNI